MRIESLARVAVRVARAGGDARGSLAHKALQRDAGRVDRKAVLFVSDSADEKSAFDEPVSKDRAQKKERRELSFEEQVADLSRFIQFEPLVREIDYKILVFCKERRELSEIERYVATLPQFKSATRDQYSLITELVNHYGLEFFELDAQGNSVTEADKEGLDEDGIDDLVESYAYQTTEVGLAIVKEFSPRARLEGLFEISPHRREAYELVMRFLAERHSFADIDTMLRLRGDVQLGFSPSGEPVQMSVLVDKLERAGMIEFDGGWILSDEGRAMLAEWDEGTLEA